MEHIITEHPRLMPKFCSKGIWLSGTSKQKQCHGWKIQNHTMLLYAVFLVLLHYLIIMCTHKNTPLTQNFGSVVVTNFLIGPSGFCQVISRVGDLVAIKYFPAEPRKQQLEEGRVKLEWKIKKTVGCNCLASERRSSFDLTTGKISLSALMFVILFLKTKTEKIGDYLSLLSIHMGFESSSLLISLPFKGEPLQCLF